jgi:hypothetical protein
MTTPSAPSGSSRTSWPRPILEGQLEYQQKLVAGRRLARAGRAIAARQGIELDEEARRPHGRRRGEEAGRGRRRAGRARRGAEEFAGAVEDQFVEEQLIELIDEEE